MYCGQTVGWNRIATWYGSRPWLRPHCVRKWKWAQQPPTLAIYGRCVRIYKPHSLCLLWPNGCMDQDATWYGGRPWPRRHCVRWGPSSPRKWVQQPPRFGPCLLWPNGWMDQDTTGYSDWPRPGDIVLDGDLAPPRKWAQQPPTFAIYGRCVRINRSPCLLWPNDCMDQDATCYGGRPRPRRHC